MESHSQVAALAALAHPQRLQVFRLLMRRAPQPVRPSEIGAALDIRPNTLSVYLAHLVRAGLATAERDGRSILYRLDRGRIASLLAYLAEDCCRGRPEICLPTVRSAEQSRRGFEGPVSALFVCSGNAARSLMAEAIVNDLGAGRFLGSSAGTKPRRSANPLAIEVLREAGHDVARLRPKDASVFRGPSAPRFDLVLTLCDDAANEDCPAWPEQPLTAHWGMPAPGRAGGTAAERKDAFWRAYRTLRDRLDRFLALPVASLDRLSLQNALDEIGSPERTVKRVRHSLGETETP